MTKRLAILATFLPALALSVGCTVHQSDSAPPLTGPSEFAQSVTITATPDRITQDGQSQSSIAVRVFDANGQPAVGVALRVDMLVDGTLVDFGRLSARTIVTGADGRATAVYTAPPAPPVSTTNDVSTVTVRAIAFGTNAQAANSYTADIRLVPPGVILPPAGTPTASFTVSPASVLTSVPANFDASASVAGTGASSITSYAWTFGDGTTGTGKTLTHTFTAPNNYSVTLTVTNDRGVAASTTQSVPVGASTLPTASFTVSPTAPGVGESVFFNAAASSAAPGRTIGSYQWSFGDGGTAGGSSTSHQYTAAGSYTVTLTVTDDIGKSSSTTQSVSIGNPPSPTANFTFSPSAPAVGDAVVFVASTSTTAQGQTITDYFWNFGDDPSCPVVSGTPPSTCYQQTSSAILTHAFTRTGTFSVNLVVRDSAGRIGSKSGSVSVTAGNPTASFTAIASGAAHTMLFDGSGSTAVGASTIRQYDWAFGDGSFSGPQTGPTVTHTYSSAGSYPVRLTVTDSLGRTGTFSSTVTVP